MKNNSDMEMLHEIINTTLLYYSKIYQRQFWQHLKISRMRLSMPIFIKAVLLSMQELQESYLDRWTPDTFSETEQLVKNLYLEASSEDPSIGQLIGYFPSGQPELEISLLYGEDFERLYYMAKPEVCKIEDVEIRDYAAEKIALLRYWHQCGWVCHYLISDAKEREWFAQLFLYAMYYSIFDKDSGAEEEQKFRKKITAGIIKNIGKDVVEDRAEMYNYLLAQMRKYGQVFCDTAADNNYRKNTKQSDYAEMCMEHIAVYISKIGEKE